MKKCLNVIEMSNNNKEIEHFSDELDSIYPGRGLGIMLGQMIQANKSISNNINHLINSIDKYSKSMNGLNNSNSRQIQTLIRLLIKSNREAEKTRKWNLWLTCAFSVSGFIVGIHTVIMILSLFD